MNLVLDTGAPNYVITQGRLQRHLYPISAVNSLQRNKSESTSPHAH